MASPGGTVSLPCEIRNATGPIRWLLNGEHASPDERRVPFHLHNGSSLLRINPVLLDDDGVWHCQDEREHGTLLFTSQPIRLIVAIAPQRPFVVFEDRRLADGATFTIKEKNTVTFTCVVGSANPAPERVDWLLGERNVTSLSRLVEDYSQTERTYQSRSVVTFEVTRKHHRRALRCEVHHLSLTSKASATLTFNILYTPSFVISRVPGFGYPIREGISVSLRCEIDANPTSKPRWIKDDGPPPILESDDGYLNFSTINREHAGWYRCATQHEFGHFASFGYFLNVRFACKPTAANNAVVPAGQETAPPCPLQADAPDVEPNPNPNHIQPPPPQIQVDLGGSVMLECAAEGKPPPSYCWARVKDGGRLESMAVEQNLLLDRILYTDAGVYKCVARNNQVSWNNEGRRAHNKEVEVVVTGKPHVEPINRTLMAIVGKPASVVVQYCSNPEPSRAHWILLRSFLLNPGDQTDRFVAHNVTGSEGSHCFRAVLEIREVRREDAGEFLFFVKNSFGLDDGVVHLNITQASFSKSDAATPSVVGVWSCLLVTAASILWHHLLVVIGS